MSPRPPEPAWTAAVPAPLWEQYLTRLAHAAGVAEAALAAGDPPGWPDLALPISTPTADQRARARGLQSRMAEVLARAQTRRDAVRQELAGLHPVRPQGDRGTLGASLDVLG